MNDLIHGSVLIVSVIALGVGLWMFSPAMMFTVLGGFGIVLVWAARSGGIRNDDRASS